MEKKQLIAETIKNDASNIIDTKILFQDNSNKVEIMHNGIIYILRVTKDNKLILTK